MRPGDRQTLAEVAADLDRFGMRRNAARVREVLAADAPPDERPCPIQDQSGEYRAIPWGLAEILYPAYGHDQSLERLAERGGFGRGELGMLAVDQYSGGKGRLGRLEKMPLLTLYESACAAASVEGEQGK